MPGIEDTRVGDGNQPVSGSDLNCLTWSQHRLAAELHAIAQQITADLSLDGALSVVLDAVTRLLQAKSVSIYLSEQSGLLPERRFTTRYTGQPHWEDRRGKLAPDGPTPTVLRTGRPLVIEDMQTDPRTRDFAEEDTRTLVAVPLRHDTRILGSLCAGWSVCRPCHPEEIQLLELLAAYGAIAIENARLHAHALAARAQAEEALRQANDDRALLELLLAAAPCGFAMFDPNLRYLLANQSLAEINGVPVAEMLGRSIWDVIPEVAPRVVPALERVRTSGEPVISWNVSGVTRGTAGKTHHWLCSYYPVQEADGQLRGIGAVVVDVTPFKQAEEERERLLAEARVAQAAAEAAREHLQRFLGIVAHDLREPLGVIGTAVQLLQEQPRRQRQRILQRLLPSIEHTTRRALLLIEDLLDAARIGAGRFQIRPGPADLVSIVRAVIDQEQATTEIHRLVLEAPPRLEGVWDPDRLAQLATNLVSNAIRYSPRGGPVVVQLERNGDEAIVRVTDQGIGVAPEHLPRLFEPFTRITSEAGANGTGLGLYIARAIAEAHGGQIGVESALNRGSTFWVRLPIQAPGPED